MRELRAPDPHAKRWILVPEAAPLLFQAGLNGREKSFQKGVVQLQMSLEEICAEPARSDHLLPPEPPEPETQCHCGVGQFLNILPNGDAFPCHVLYVVECPEVGTISQGRTIEEAIANLQEATELYLEEFPVPATTKPFFLPKGNEKGEFTWALRFLMKSSKPRACPIQN